MRWLTSCWRRPPGRELVSSRLDRHDPQHGLAVGGRRHTAEYAQGGHEGSRRALLGCLFSPQLDVKPPRHPVADGLYPQARLCQQGDQAASVEVPEVQGEGEVAPVRPLHLKTSGVAIRDGDVNLSVGLRYTRRLLKRLERTR